MKRFVELVDLVSGNIVQDFDVPEDALEFLNELVVDHGAAAAQDYIQVQFDDSGRWSLLFDREQLLDRLLVGTSASAATEVSDSTMPRP